uniref:Snf2-related CREBBP activator protein n=1 Tax=Salarias fasciatus TaxID=181472 RepID=A0A672H9V4_SALFA
PSTSAAGYPGPSHSHSLSLSPSPGPSDWSTPRREKSSPLRGASAPRLETQSVSFCVCLQEADIEHRTQALKREGFWSTKRLTRLTEPQRPKVHWDYLCEEMQWLSADFAQERRWKRGVARKVVRMVMRHHEDLRQKEEKAKRDEHAKIRRVASSIAKEVRAFWSNVEKVVQYKQQSRLEEKRKKALDLQLDFIVGQTEKYSDLLSKSLAPTCALSAASSSWPSPPVADRDFEPPGEEEDDEETIEVEEQQEGNDAETHRREIELLKEEGLLPLDQLISTLKLPQVPRSGPPSPGGEEEERKEEDEDGEFTANEEDAEDEEDTIAAQEKVEGNVNHAEELDDLAREGEHMSMEELLEKYRGAYASDFEAPSASASGSKASSDMEDSGDEEAESEEDESDVESNSSSSDSAGDSAEDESEKEEGESEEDEGGDEGMEVLLKEGDHSPPSSGSRPKKEISHIAATAESLQPKGYTLATTKVKTPIPFLLHGTLREYQHIGLDWLVTMYEKKLNGILADEMGLGKTIQTIALLAHLACEKGNWGPHLIIVPTSVMLNWEMELKRWCPGFKILTYFGSQKERKLKRQGWTKPNAFHVCITSYKLVLQDHQAFRRKSWRYLILDEAQNIKNFKSQRWQSLLNFNSHRRLLLTGTPLQNSLMELWSLMHFLMPHVFQSHREFKEWFSNPLTGMIEGSQEYNEGLVKRLHKVLRPFLLRRIKVDVEKQMPKKYEHVVRCRLSKRQRFLYDDFMAQASTRETLASGHFMSVINILMQLRKVCNHPNLFDPRPIQSPFITQPIIFHTASLVQDALDVCPLKRCDLSMFHLVALERRVSRYQADVFLPRHKVSRQLIQEIVESPEPPPRPRPVRMKVNRMFQPPPKGDNRPVLLMNKPTCSVAPAAQTPKPPPVTEVAPTPAPPPVVQQGTRPTALQRRTVVSIAQLASLAGRPVSSCQGSKPVTFQLQGNKLTLSGAQIHQVPAAAPRPLQGETPGEALLLPVPAAVGLSELLSPPLLPSLFQEWLSDSLKQQQDSRLDFIFGVNERRCGARPLYGREVLDFLTFLPGSRPSPAPPRPEADWGRSGHSSCLLAQAQNRPDLWRQSAAVREAIHGVEDRLELLADVIDRFTFAIPPVEAPPISMHCCHPPPSLSHKQAVFSAMLAAEAAPLTGSLHRIQCYMRTQFPDLRLIQYDCGKLQTLHTLLRKLKTGGHRVLIFTQMTRMLDVLEQFLNYHGHIYLRLDGSTRVEQRQALMERFNADRRIFCFILSTRSGGVGVNLTGADTVVFYDSDWNPTMDAQAQDRCHRIGQTRDVHIYRLISERTVEENILKKANQKRMLGDMAIEGGNFTTAFFKQQTIRELFDMNDGEKREAAVELSLPHGEEEEGVNKQSTTILEQALCRAEDEEDIVAASQAKAEQVAELAEFNENIPLDDGGEQEEVEELSKAEQEIAALVEQLTPIERYAMNFLEASLEDVCKEELKQAEVKIHLFYSFIKYPRWTPAALWTIRQKMRTVKTTAPCLLPRPAPDRLVNASLLMMKSCEAWWKTLRRPKSCGSSQGRLVTVVEEKEPRRRRRRGSGTGGSLEEAAAEESADEPNKDNTPLSSDGKTKATVTKSPQGQDPTPSPSVIPQPVRSYPPYSPP